MCVNDPWDYAVEPFMADRSKVRFHIKRFTGVYIVRGRSRLASGIRLLTSLLIAGASEPANHRSDAVTPEEDPISLKQAKLDGSASRKGPDIGPTVCWGRGNRSNEIPWTWHQGEIEGAGGVFGQ